VVIKSFVFLLFSSHFFLRFIVFLFTFFSGGNSNRKSLFATQRFQGVDGDLLGGDLFTSFWLKKKY